MKLNVVILVILLNSLLFAQSNIDELITKLGDEDPKVRQQAQDELTLMGSKAKAALKKALSSDDAEVQSRAKQVLKLFEKIEELIEKLNSAYLEERNNAKDSLISIGKPSESFIIEQLDFQEPRGKLYSISILTKLGNKTEVEKVGTFFEGLPPDEESLAICLDYLKQCGLPAESYLVAALDKPFTKIVKDALLKINELSIKVDPKKLYDVYNKHEDQQIKKLAFDAIKTHKKEAKEYLIKFLSEQDTQIRKEAIQELALLKDDEEVYQAVSGLLKTEIVDEVITQLFSFLDSVGEKSEDLLIEALDSNSKLTRTMAIIRLAKLGSKKCLERISNLAKKTDDTETKKACISYLVRFIDESGDYLVSLLDDPKIKQEVIYNLAQVKSKIAIDKIAKILKEDKDDAVRLTALDYFESIGKESEEYLIPVLSDKNKKIVIAVVEILGQIRSENAIKPLCELFETPHSELKDAIIDTLAFIGEKAIEQIELLSKEKEQFKQALDRVKKVHSQIILERALINNVTAQGNIGYFNGQFKHLKDLNLDKKLIGSLLFEIAQAQYKVRIKERSESQNYLRRIAVTALTDFADDEIKEKLTKHYNQLIKEKEVDVDVIEIIVTLHRLGETTYAMDYLKKLENEIEQSQDKHQALEHIFWMAVIQNRIGLFDDALKTYQRLIEQSKDEQFGEISKIYYNICCIYSLKGEKSKAIEYLKKAIESGFKDKAWIEIDGDLNNIRGTSEYKELISNEEIFKEVE